MQFNSTATSVNDIVGDVKFWCKIPSANTTLYPLEDIARNSNMAMDRVSSLIMKADNKWEWDDTNETDLPIGNYDLVDGQQDYPIATTHLKIHRVRVKDSAGNYVVLEPTNRRDLTDSELNATSGTPRKYDKLGNSIFLYPKPSASGTTLSAGLEVQFQRGASYFLSTDTIKTPGFASQFHRLISLHASLDYCEANGIKDRVAIIRNKIGRPPEGNDPGAGMEGELVNFYANRSPDTKNTMTLAEDDYGQGLLSQDGQFGNNQDGFF